MGLFSKKDPCAICGGKVKGLFANKIEDQYICKECYGTVDIPDNGVNNMTLDDFKTYMFFREQNQMLKEHFQQTNLINCGFFGTDYVFDLNHGYMCMDRSLSRTIFEAHNIKSFSIKEDNTPIFEGDATGFRKYKSSVPQKVEALIPRIRMFMLQVQQHKEMERRLDRLDDGQRNYSANLTDPRIDLPEPFEKFHIEIRFDHPYWGVHKNTIKGPKFSSTEPDPNDYMRLYMDTYKLMTELAAALASMAFPNAPVQEIDNTKPAAGTSNAAQSVDAVTEIQRYKELLDKGIITEEEFNTKKRQLMGI